MTHVAPANNYSFVSGLESKVVSCLRNIDDDLGFWAADMSRVRESLELWETHLPDVKMHYAVKCCNEPNLLHFLAAHGIGFDCASKNELETILSLNVDPSRIVYAHPLKNAQSIGFAKEASVRRLVFDSPEELEKILKLYADAEVFLRVKPRFSNAKIQLSNKFGADPDAVPDLLRLCAEKKANFIGFSFHVGSLCDDVSTFKVALDYVAELATKAEDMGLKVRFIDIGGGFLPPNAPANVPFADIADAIRDTITKNFQGTNIEFIAEPGRFIASEYMDLHLPVIGAKIHCDKSGVQSQSVYIPDGIYGSFNSLTYDHAEPHFEMYSSHPDNSELIETTLWGQTCDSADIVYTKLMWPRMHVGDLISIRKFGAYTYSPTSFFNGFPHHKVFVFNDDD